MTEAAKPWIEYRDKLLGYLNSMAADHGSEAYRATVEAADWAQRQIDSLAAASPVAAAPVSDAKVEAAAGVLDELLQPRPDDEVAAVLETEGWLEHVARQMFAAASPVPEREDKR